VNRANLISFISVRIRVRVCVRIWVWIVLASDQRSDTDRGTGHWSEGSLVRKLYSRRVRVRVRVG